MGKLTEFYPSDPLRVGLIPSTGSRRNNWCLIKPAPHPLRASNSNQNASPQGGKGQFARYQGSTRPICSVCSESVSLRPLGPDATYGASLSRLHTDWVPQNAPKRVAPRGRGNGHVPRVLPVTSAPSQSHSVSWVQTQRMVPH